MLVLADGYTLEPQPAGRRLSFMPASEAALRGVAVQRVGIINLMPKAESYESYLLRPLANAATLVEPVWLRLESHGYSSSDPAHIQRHYRTFSQALGGGQLSGLILTGAPVEELSFEVVHYWQELTRVLGFARSNFKSTLGLCWGGLALAKLVGLDKVLFPKKLFGVFLNRNLNRAHPISGEFDDSFSCAHSRHSGIADRVLEDASDRGLVNLLSHGPETGYSLFESSDRRFLMHLGHPEYEAGRLVHEWQRDQALGRNDVERPANFDPDQPRNLWRSHRNALFAEWLKFLAD
ncbi:MAG: homoserine O-succinyltransferase [Pseudomonadota bacterium]